MTDAIRTARAPTLADILGDEGLRLLFPLSALHAALWPVLWAVVNGFCPSTARSRRGCGTRTRCCSVPSARR
ncbi:hypothetical protein ACJ41P_26185 [Azospirillum argentinense]|uniref:Uncharacterized protein n=1 Tax=Azospirillum argentinense TaxID=2970906 RepID=A0ABW8VGK9_9PROT